MTNSAITLFLRVCQRRRKRRFGDCLGDEVQITYVSNNPANDQYFSLILFNCVSNCNGNPMHVPR